MGQRPNDLSEITRQGMSAAADEDRNKGAGGADEGVNQLDHCNGPQTEEHEDRFKDRLPWVPEGPREKLLQRGPRALSDAELLAVLLRTGLPGEPVTALARRLLAAHDGLAGLLSNERRELLGEPGIGPATLALLLAALELGRRCAEQPLTRRSVMTNPSHTQLFLRQHLALESREIFCCLYLDAQHRLIFYEDLFTGTLDGAAVYPREVVAGALRQRAAAVILAHNHPSGLIEPSEADRRITRRLCDALALVDVRVLDHVIVGRGASYSFAEEGLL